MRPRSLSLIAVVLLCTYPVTKALQAAANTQDNRGVKPSAAGRSSGTNRRIVVSVGIDQYRYWPKLGTAVSDAVGFSRLLVDRFGFQELGEPLLDAAATKDRIVTLIEDRLRTELKQDDDVIFFFAGHGTTRVDEVGGQQIETGYIIPVEASGPGAHEQWSNYIQMSELLQEIGKLPPRHVLVILDACHSGFALGNAMQKSRDAPRYQLDLTSRVSRVIIMSARRDQPASDAGPVPNHSLFTGLLLQGLSDGSAGDKNGIITSRELGLYIQQVVGQDPTSKQTPDYGSFYLDDRGEMVLSVSAQPSGKTDNASVIRHKVDPDSSPFKSRFVFNSLPIHLTVTQDGSRFEYGYSSVESDPTVAGQDVQISKVQVEMEVKPNTPFGCCDVWVLLGPTSVRGIHPPGQVIDHYFWVSANSSQAPVQAQFVIGREGLK